MKRRLLTFIITSLACIASAQDNGTGLKQRTSLTAVRMSIVNGVVQTINNTRQVNIRLEWDYLPLSHLLSDKAASFDVHPITFDISNNDLKTGADWVSKLKPDQKQLLMRALYLPENTSFATSDNREAASQKAIASFENAWYSGEGMQLRGSSISVSDFLASQRDFFCLLTLLRSYGVNSSFSVENADVKGPNPRINSDDIQWRISIYEMKIVAGRSLYRITAAAKEDGFPVMFSNPNDTTATLNAKFSFIRHRNEQGQPDDILSGIAPQYLSLLVQKQDVSLPSAPDKKLNDPTDSLAPSSLESTLQLVGGVDLNDVISKGLLGGSAQSSFVSGGLFGRGRVSQLLGISTDIWRRGRNAFGYTLGALPDDQNALFTGLTTQFGDLMLIPGFIAQPNSDNTKTAFKGALGVSFDLGRVLGMKKDNTYTVANCTNDPNWPSSDELFANVAGISYTLAVVGTNLLAPAEIRLNWKTPDGADLSTVLPPASTPALSALNVGNANVIIPLGYNLSKVNKNLVTGADVLVPVQTAINWSGDRPPTLADAKNLAYGQQLLNPVSLTSGSAQLPLNYKLAPGDGLLSAADITPQVAADLQSDAAKPLFDLLSTEAQDVVGRGVSDDSDKSALAVALDFVIAGPLLTANQAFGQAATVPSVATELKGNHSLNNVRMRVNRRTIETLLPSLPKMQP